jgi:hypothetical protein
MNDTSTPDAAEQRIRHALHAVAETVTENSFATDGRPGKAPKPRRKRRIALAVGALTLVPAGFASAAFLNTPGDEYVDQVPQERIVMEGSVDGSRYLLIESNRTNKCGDPVTGVELVEENKNLLGSEWSTTGYQYGEATWLRRCGDEGVDTSRYLQNPALFNQSGAQVGDSFVWVYAVHPEVTSVRITSGDYTKELTVYEVDGAGYAPFEIPTDLDSFTSELLIDDQVVPGSQLERRAPEAP